MRFCGGFRSGFILREGRPELTRFTLCLLSHTERTRTQNNLYFFAKICKVVRPAGCCQGYKSPYLGTHDSEQSERIIFHAGKIAPAISKIRLVVRTRYLIRLPSRPLEFHEYTRCSLHTQRRRRSANTRAQEIAEIAELAHVSLRPEPVELGSARAGPRSLHYGRSERAA